MTALTAKIAKHLFSIEGIRRDWNDARELLTHRLPEHLHWKHQFHPQAADDHIGRQLNKYEKTQKSHLRNFVFLGIGPTSTALAAIDIYSARMIPTVHEPHRAIAFTFLAAASNLLLMRKNMLHMGFAGSAVRKLEGLYGRRTLPAASSL